MNKIKIYKRRFSCMRENLGHIFLVLLLVIEFYILLVEILIQYFHVDYEIGFYFFAGAFLIMLYLMVASCQAPMKEEERIKVLKRYDFLRLELSIILILLGPILSIANQILFRSNSSSDLFAFILAVYFAGFSLAIDGLFPTKQDLVPLETQITDLTKGQAMIINRLEALANKTTKMGDEK